MTRWQALIRPMSSTNGSRQFLPLTSRDLAVMVDVYRHRYLSVSQVKQLHFPSLQTTYRRLRALTSSGHLAGFLVPGIPEHIYFLKKPGAEEVAAHLGVPVPALAWAERHRQPKDYYFLRHFLKINDFWITLRQQAASSGAIEIAGFLPEYMGRQRDDGSVAKYIRDVVIDKAHPGNSLPHTPDAVFALMKGGSPALFFLEIDRGTEVISDPDKGVLKALRFYAEYLLTAKYQRYAQDFSCGEFKGFRALFVTTSPVRVQNIRQELAGVALGSEKVARFIWLTDEDRLRSSGIFAPIWVSAAAQDQAQYRIG
jgi:hypothetical protein